jgi:hypothetical protein
MTITVDIKSNYGQQAVYPVCKQAMIFARLANTKTLTPYTLELVKQLGYSIVIQAQTL